MERLTDAPPAAPAGYFDRLYASSPDPWRYASSPYEREKYAATLDALPERRFNRALEVGCSIGVFTEQLAQRCDDLLAVDIADGALRQTQLRCARQQHVRIQRCDVLADWPAGCFDLIVLSEVLYYLGTMGIRRVAGHIQAALTQSGSVLLVNWLGVTGMPLTGDEAASIFIQSSPLAVDHQQKTGHYRLDRLSASTGTPSHSICTDHGEA